MSSRKGWVKAHRSFLDWEWMRKGHSFKVMMALVFKANYEPNTYQGTLVDRGSLIIGRDLFASELGISVQQLRTILRNLESTGEITTKSSRKGTVVTVVRYEDYQSSTSEPTSKPTAKPTPPATTLKEVEEEKNTMSDQASPAENGVLELIEEANTDPETDPESEFLEALWNASPGKSRNRSSKKEVKQEWRRIPKKDRPPFETVMESLLDWVRCPDWTKEGGKYATGLHRWIKACKWESSPDHTPEQAQQSFADQRRIAAEQSNACG